MTNRYFNYIDGRHMNEADVTGKVTGNIGIKAGVKGDLPRRIE
jgi:hypothetical protein